MTMTITLDVPQHRAGLRQAVRAEWTKLATLRSTKWALLVTAVGTALVTFLSTHGALHESPGFYRGFDPTNMSLAGLALGSLVMGILGTLSMTGEYGTGTIRSSLAATPRRGVLYGAKAIVMGTVGLGVGLILTFMAFFEGQAILSGGAPTATLGDPGVLRALLESAVFLALLTLFGLGIGAIIRHSAGAIATFVGTTLLLPVLLHNVAGDPSRYMPDEIYANSVAAVVRIDSALSSTAGLLLMAFYTALTLAVGGALLSKRDA